MQFKYILLLVLLITFVKCQQNGESFLLFPRILMTNLKLSVKFCSKSSPQLNECLKKLINSWFRAYSKNDLYKFNRVHVNVSNPLVDVDGYAKNLLIKGFSKSYVTEARNDLKTLKFAIKFKTPHVELESFYDGMANKIVFLPSSVHTRGKVFAKIGRNF